MKCPFLSKSMIYLALRIVFVWDCIWPWSLIILKSYICVGGSMENSLKISFLLESIFGNKIEIYDVKELLTKETYFG